MASKESIYVKLAGYKIVVAVYRARSAIYKTSWAYHRRRWISAGLDGL